MPIEFEDSKELRIRFYSIVVNVSTINETFGRVYDFCKKYDITGITNGELLVLYFMSYPSEYYDNLILNVFEPNGFEYKKDYVFVEEELVFGVKDYVSSDLNLPLSSFENINWIGSILRKNGNWVWKINQ
jgi:hypothetical protein